ncbi:MAG TPA: GGDEF domain-containing protein [Sphingomicrobium sp.]|nr:GGDEF domain-containing protein [Sphingomicrobium sp.]
MRIFRKAEVRYVSLRKRGFGTAMEDSLLNLSDSEALAAEIARLRDEVARLQGRVDQLDQMAHQDVLIGLPNRRGFMRQLGQLIARINRYDDLAAMLFIDVDGLKLINDSCGHQAGDEALMFVAELLVRGVRSSDYVARIGGDEFGILLEHADESVAAETASRLVSQIAGCEFCYEGSCLPLSVAIGFSLITKGDSSEEVIQRADLAMYAEKAAA